MSGMIDPATLVACMGGFLTACFVSANGKAIEKKGKMLFKKLSKWAQRKWLQKILAFKALRNSRDSKQISRPDERKVIRRIPTANRIAEIKTSTPVFV